MTAGRLLTFAAMLVFAACDNSTEPSTPATITATTGATITGRVAEQKTVTVNVAASNGRTLSNQPVTFSIASGAGAVTPTTATTDANGQATAVWTLGNVIGAQTLIVGAGAITQTISATVSAGLPASVTVQQGSGQTAPVGTAVASAPAVIVRDAAGNPIAGVPVTFTVAPSGSVTPAQTTTDASGIARVTNWTLGNQAGTYTLTVTVLDPNIRTGNPLTITATATAGAAARVQPVAGLPTSGTAGTALAGAALPAVTVLDANGNPVANVPVTFSVTSGGGALTGATATTNAQGVATVGGFTLGNTAGPNIVQATAAGAGTASIVITGTAGAAAQTQIVAGTNNGSVRAGQPLQVGPSVRVVDRNGNPVAGATVNFVVTGGGGSVMGATQVTNALGIATVGGYTLGPIPGTNTLVARVAGLTDVTFTATGLAGAPTTITKVSGDSLSVIAFRTAAQPVIVEVRDSASFPVRNATVTFALTNPAGGSLTATTVTTDSLGRASTTFVANGVLGTNTITAIVGTLPAAQFTVTTTGNTAGTVSLVQGDGQIATAGTALPISPTVQVRDASGNPVPGVPVFFDVFGGQGTVQFPVDTTDANGIASAGTWTLNGAPGVNTLAATVAAAQVGGNPIIFRATGITVPAGATLSVVAGQPPATASPGSTVPVAVQVKDANGNGVANISVLFQVASGGGSIGGQQSFSTTTDASGFARVPGFTLSSTLGTANTITAQVTFTGLSTAITVTTQ